MADEVGKSDRDLPKILAFRALRLHGGKALLTGEKPDYSVGANRVSVWLLIYILASLAFLAVTELKWSVVTAIFSIMALLVGGAFAMYFKSCTARSFYLFFVLLWLVSFGWLVVSGRWSAVLVAYILPIIVVMAVKWGLSALSLAVTIPLFIPVVFIVVLAPLLTEDPWRLASEAGFIRIGVLASVSIIPLSVFAVRRVWRNTAEDSLRRAFEFIAADKDAHRKGAEVALKVKNANETIVKTDLETSYYNAFRKPLEPGCVSYIASVIDKKFRRRSVRLLLVLIVGVSISTFVLVYALAATAMPAGLASDWSEVVAINHLDLHPFDYTVRLPLGPYLSVSALFAALATVGFLAFASTEDKYADAIVNSVAIMPARRLAYMATVFHHLEGHPGCGMQK